MGIMASEGRRRWRAVAGASFFLCRVHSFWALCGGCVLIHNKRGFELYLTNRK